MKWKWGWVFTVNREFGVINYATQMILHKRCLERLQTELSLKTGDKVSVLVNSLGATPLEELYILYNKITQLIDKTGATIVHPLVGRYATSMEMTGASLTLCKLDDELEALMNAPAHCAFWRV